MKRENSNETVVLILKLVGVMIVVVVVAMLAGKIGGAAKAAVMGGSGEEKPIVETLVGGMANIMGLIMGAAIYFWARPLAAIISPPDAFGDSYTGEREIDVIRRREAEAKERALLYGDDNEVNKALGADNPEDDPNYVRPYYPDEEEK
jgi:hypothetical protein